MTLLTRYLIRQNLFLIFSILLTGCGIYVLTDLFERLDDFIKVGMGIGGILFFFLAKLPIIISQILPAVFLLGLVIQLNILERNRELVALYAGGISPIVLIRFILLYGILWGATQFLFAQVVGVVGEQVSTRIWREEVRGDPVDKKAIRRLWLTEKNRIIHIGEAIPGQGTGSDLLVYSLDKTGVTIDEIVRAKSFTIEKGHWVLHDGERVIPAQYSKTDFKTLQLPIKQNLEAFQMFVSSGIRPSQLSLWDLSKSIKRLERAGSNVEVLRTAWHGKLSYAVSIVIMGFLALIVSQITSNVYKAVGLALIAVFLFFSINTLFSSMGEKGMLTPMIGAWFADGIFLVFSFLWFTWPVVRQKIHR